MELRLPEHPIREPHLQLMKNISLTALFILLLTFTTTAQDTLAWVNSQARGLNDLSFLSSELKDKRVVGLAEASHGTHEFYAEKTRIIKHLIENDDFRLLAFEFTEKAMAPVNHYLQTGTGDLRSLMKGFVLYGTEEIFDLFTMIRKINQKRSVADRVVLVGVDSEDYWGDPYTRDEHMTRNFVKAFDQRKGKAIVWGHNVHLVKDTLANPMAMGGHLNLHFKNEFYSVGFDTYKGHVHVLEGDAFEAHPFQAADNTLSGLLSRANRPSFFLPIHKGSLLYGTAALITNVYAEWREPKPLTIKPGTDFDAIVFIRETSPSIQLK